MIQNLDSWIKAGKITKEIIEKAKKIIENGVSILDVCEKMEKLYNPAFPINISMNEVAAHDTADINDDRILEGVIKVDVGAQIDGYIGDSAITIDLTDKYSDLINANVDALETGIREICEKKTFEINKISLAIYECVKKHKLGVITNLSGHGLEKYNIHSKPTIPNYPTNTREILKSGTVIAIEPFITKEDSQVKESGKAKIFQYVKDIPIRDSKTRDLRDYIKENYKTLPFAKRWLLKDFKFEDIERCLGNLIRNGNVIEYKPLRNVSNSIVTQFEHTILIEEKEIKVLTR
ncbi:MAG: type II methionyl aminopeptidase [Candidatus Woesearchaeota archaeon]